MSENKTGPSELTLTEKFNLQAEDFDFKGKMKFYRICGYLFEMATIHAGKLHYGFEDMKLSNHYWVLARLLVRVNQYPDFGQNIIVETWTKGIARLFALRDFRITDEHKNTLAVATTAWLAIDKTSGRPGNPEYLKQFHSYHAGKHAIREVPKKIDPPDYTRPEVSIPVHYTDLDINKHVNAGKYIAWIQDQFKLEHYLKKQIKSFQINYHNETRFGETVQLFISPEKESGSHMLVEGKIESSGNTAFRASIGWEEIRDP